MKPLVEGQLLLLGGLTERLFDLLTAIESTGSLNRAARAVGLSYKGAWEMLERANNAAPSPLIASSIGGKQGGGSLLTPFGKELLTIFSQFQVEHRRFLEGLNQQLAEHPKLNLFFRRLTMQASARNQLFGTIKDITIGAVNAEVTVELKGGDGVVAAITKESAQSMGIDVGMEAIALIKAPLIIVAKDCGGYVLSARNQLKGMVSRLQKGSDNSEAVIELAGGESIAAIITNESVESMGLKLGDQATAIFKAGSVILGVART